MKVAEKVGQQVGLLADGATFRYQNLQLDPKEYVNAAKAIERLIRKGLLKRVSTGIFYKPQMSVFGELAPSEDEILKSYLFQGGNRVAYITGIALYNRLGLTTQVPSVLKVACSVKQIDVRIGNLVLKPARSYVEVTDGNYYLLEILDAFKDFNAIPDLDRSSAITLLRNKVLAFSERDLAKLLDLVLRYPPRTRALFGAVMSATKVGYRLKKIQLSLNPLTLYKFDRIFDLLPSARDWNIR